jgi:hypothetical protein
MAPQQPNIPPPAKGMSPQQYYSFLTQRGVPGWAAYDAVQANYGGQSNQNEEPDQGYQYGQVAGLVGGSMLGQEIASGFPTVGGLFGGGSGAGAAKLTTDASIAAPKIIGAKAAGGAATGGATTGASTLGSIGSVALPAAAIVAALSETWEGGAKDILRGRGNKQDWANMGVNAATGVLPNLVLRWMGKPSIGRMITSGKSDAQLLRDDFRGSLKEAGIADEKYQVTLADGSKFDIGKDGKAKLANVDQETSRRYYEVDLNNPLATYAIPKIDAFVRGKYGPDAESAGYKPEQFTAMLVNAATSNAKTQAEVDANIAAILKQQQPEKQTKPGQYGPEQNTQQLQNIMNRLQNIRK